MKTITRARSGEGIEIYTAPMDTPWPSLEEDPPAPWQRVEIPTCCAAMMIDGVDGIAWIHEDLCEERQKKGGTT